MAKGTEPTTSGGEVLSLGNREAWRRWLRQNHRRRTGVWLTIQKKHVPHGIKLGEAVEEAICFGWIDSRMRSTDGDSFILRFSPRRKNSPWSAANKEKAVNMIRQGRMTSAGEKVIQEAKANGSWESAYSSRTTPPVPDDLMKALRRDETAWKNFGSLTNSRQMALIFWVNGAKRAATRAKRIEEVVRLAETNVKTDQSTVQGT